MAQQEQLIRRKQELVAQLAEHRKSITQHRLKLTEQLQVKQLVKKLFISKPKSIFAGSAVAGLAAALFLRRPHRAKKSPQSMSLVLLGWTLSLLKPAAQAWVTARAKEALSPTPSPRQPMQ